MSRVMSMCMYRYTILLSGCDRKQSCSSHLQTKWRRQWLSWSPKWTGFGLHVTTGGWSDRGASNHLREHWRKVQACKGQGDKRASGFQVMILCVRVYTHIIVIYDFCMCMRVYIYICVYNRYIHIRIGSVNVWGVQSSKHSSGDQDALHCILLIQRHGRQAWHQAPKLLRDCSLTQLTFRIPKKRLHSKAFSGVTSFLIRNA